MNGFGFSLPETVSLEEDEGKYYLFSAVPLKILRLNRSLYHLLEYIDGGRELEDYLKQNPGIDASKAVRGLLYLVSRGYLDLELERLPDIDNWPFVSVIIPVKDRVDDITKCLHALQNVDYPPDKLEIIVVDDGSEDDLSDMAVTRHVKVVRQESSVGPAACRNIGARNACGEIFAFLDADCAAGDKWLKELVPFFRAHNIGAVGGYIDGYSRTGLLDRYEAVFSSLNMGSRLLLEGNSDSSLYVPTASMLVSRQAFEKTGGFDESLHIGEDVDFCWRMRKLDFNLLYIPRGSVAHKHRSDLPGMLTRRFEYGTSEAFLYRTHPEKKKSFTVSPFAAFSVLAVSLFILLLNLWPLLALVPLLAADLFRHNRKIGDYNMSLSFDKLLYITLRTWFSFFYYTFFHLVRYYLVLFIVFGFLWYPVWLLGALMLLCASLTDYFIRRPSLKYPYFLFFYLAEHLFYQAGVFWGCIKRGYFGSYLLSFKRP